ncbi:MAG: protein-disulfide reductase DsbD domain-containing protein, partial [Verrucomicrobiota bacterium]
MKKNNTLTMIKRFLPIALLLGPLMARAQFSDFGLGLDQPKEEAHVTAQWISEGASIQPGQPFWLALHLKMDAHWHTYWKNAGDAGLATSVDPWELPEGFTAGELQWPWPERIVWQDFVNFGYHDEVFLPVRITPPADLEAGKEVTLGGTASWLVCKDVCIMGSTNISLTLPVSADPPVANDKWASAFESTRKKLPLTDAGWSFAGYVQDDKVTIQAGPASPPTEAIEMEDFFPYPEMTIAGTKPAQWTRTDSGSYELTAFLDESLTNTPERLSGVILAKQGWDGEGSTRSIAFDVALTEGPPPAGQPEEQGTTAAPTAATEETSAAPPAVKKPAALPVQLLFAFLGGLILNL